MQADRVHSALLECMTQLPLVLALAENQFSYIDSQLSLYGIEQESFDYNRLRLLAGFMTRVRHNEFSRTLPLSMSFMLKTDLDFELFTGYAGIYLKLKELPEFNKSLQIKEFLAFLQSAAEKKNDWRLWMLLDLFHYEQCLLAASKSESDPAQDTGLPDVKTTSPPPLVSCKPTSAQYFCAPRVLGIDRYSYHPEMIIEVLPLGLEELSALEPVNTVLAILKGTGNEIEIIEIDAVAAALLSLINGKRSTQALTDEINQLYSLGLDRENVEIFLIQLQKAGLIEDKKFSG